MDDAFLAALFPGEFRVCGYRLHPYCAGHLAALCIYGSPIVGIGAEITASDLVQALRICSAPGFPIVTPSRLKPRLRDRVVGRWLSRSAARLQAAVDAFQAYQVAHYSFPTFYANEPTGEDPEAAKHSRSRPLSAPFLLARACALTKRTSLSDEAVWRMPLALPSWYIGTLDEMEGAPVRFLAEGEDTTEDLPPDVGEMDEAEVYEMALQTMGREYADKWRERARREKGIDHD